jgi:hypothetical protein
LISFIQTNFLGSISAKYIDENLYFLIELNTRGTSENQISFIRNYIFGHKKSETCERKQNETKNDNRNIFELNST